MAIKFCVCFHFSASAFFVCLTFVMRYSSARGENMLRKEIERSENGSFCYRHCLLLSATLPSLRGRRETQHRKFFRHKWLHRNESNEFIQHVSHQWQRMFTRRHLTVITTKAFILDAAEKLLCISSAYSATDATGKKYERSKMTNNRWEVQSAMNLMHYDLNVAMANARDNISLPFAVDINATQLPHFIHKIVVFIHISSERFIFTTLWRKYAAKH